MGGSRVPPDNDDGQRIAELERKIEELTGALRDANRPAFQVIQRVENEPVPKKPEVPESESAKIVAWGCAASMIIFVLWIIIGSSCTG